MIKRIIIKAAVLIPVFVAALLFFNYEFNTKNELVVLQMDEPTFPTVSFALGEYEINTINGYASQMDITGVRDTIVPTEGRHTVSMTIHPYGNTISSADLKVYDITGSRVLETGTLNLTEQENGDLRADVQFDDSWSSEREAVMEITIGRSSEDPVYFYTRVTRTSGVNAESAVDFCLRFSELTRTPEEEETVKAYLESNSYADNGTFHYVDMYCSTEQVMWNGLCISSVGEACVRMTECNEVYSNLEVSYTLEAGSVTADGTVDEESLETYDVTEFYRVRAGFSHFYILNFERTMNVQYQSQSQFLTATGLDLGITDPDTEWVSSADGSIITYITGDALWQYRLEDNSLRKIFSFRKRTDNDERDTYRGHEISILSTDDNGSITFRVSGYMNCGEYEGLTGTACCYYDADLDLVKKLAFIPSSKGAELTIADAPRSIYYDAATDLLYIVTDSELMSMEISTGEKSVILDGLDIMEYSVSEDGQTLAYIEDDENGTVNIMKLSEGTAWQISPESGTYLRLMGFIGDGLMVGYGQDSDIGTDSLGNEIRPVNSIRIFDSEGSVIKEYTSSTGCIISCSVNGSLATVSLGSRTGSVYVEQGTDYISMNDSDDEAVNNASLETYQDGTLERCVRIAISDELSVSQPVQSTVRILGESLDNRIETETVPVRRYYVYAGTHLQKICDDAGEAINLADSIYGVVVMEDGRYLWERGNRDLVMRAGDINTINMSERKITNVLAACGQMLIEYLAIPGDVSEEMLTKGLFESLEKLVGQGNCVEMTSLSPDKLFYIVDQDQPVIAITGENKGIVIFGYDEEGADVYDPISGRIEYLSNETLESECAAGGNQYLTVIR